MKKLTSLILSTALVFSLSIPALAATDVTTPGGNAETPVTLTAAAATFSVTVPMNFPINVDAEGKVLTATGLKIVNKSSGMVEVANVSVSGASDWEITSYDTDMGKEKVGAKKVGFIFNGDKTIDDTGTITMTADSWKALAGKNDDVANTDELPITYDAKLPAQRDAIDSENVANITFVIRWHTAP